VSRGGCRPSRCSRATDSAPAPCIACDDRAIVTPSPNLTPATDTEVQPEPDHAKGQSPV
jgi:hypothetical protein